MYPSDSFFFSFYATFIAVYPVVYKNYETYFARNTLLNMGLFKLTKSATRFIAKYKKRKVSKVNILKRTVRFYIKLRSNWEEG